MSYHVCIDMGGKFTDCLVSNETAGSEDTKRPRLQREFEKGFVNALGVAAEGLGLAPSDFVAQIDIIVHGSTVATNALVERRPRVPGHCE